MIATWTAAEIAPGRSGCQREPVVGTVLDDPGGLRRDDEDAAVRLDCEICRPSSKTMG